MALYLQATVLTYVSMAAQRGSELVTKLHRDVRGQDTLEWAMISGIMGVALIGAFLILNPAITTFANNVKNCVDFDSSTTCVAGL